MQDIMRKDAGTYGDAQRLEQLGWLMFLKILSDREQELILLRPDYKSPLPKALKWDQWAANEEGITGDALLAFVNDTLLPRLKSLPVAGGDKLPVLIRSTFADANNYMKNGTLLRQVVNKINGIDFNASEDRHLFGDIYEKLLRDLQAAGNAGEFYTPRAVTEFIVQQIDPRLGETVLDPACGTGGFLTCAIEHLHSQAARVVTISIGLAVLDPGAEGDFEALFQEADQALYRAKAAGRNQVAGPDAPAPASHEGETA